MPSLLERVGRSLTRKKPEVNTNNRDSGGTALEGFQQISPNDVKGYVPPISATSPSQEKSQGAFQSFLRSKSPQRNAAPLQQTPARAPLLSLHLPGLSENASASSKDKLGIEFEPRPDPAYSDDVIAAKRLNTAETLSVVQKTSSALIQGGLETPGIFKSFWHKQNADSQRKLIVAFLQAFPITDLSNGADAAANPTLDTLNARLSSTSPHDLAEVFKWALRHFNHDGASFGTSSEWYKAFAEAEKTANYPPDAYTTILAPLLPAPHLELLNSVFHTASSVAAYGESNGVSGSKFTRSVGWWLLSERPTPSNGLVGFLQDWETAARILEHLFLAYVRDQQKLGLMPKRLTQLVKAYPYPKQASPTDQYYLPRPKFSTQPRTVLYIRASVSSNAAEYYNGRPIQLLKDAIVAPAEDSPANADYRAIWESIKKQAITETAAPSSPVDNAQSAPVISVTTLLSEGAIHILTTSTGESAVTSPAKTSESSWTRFSSPVKKESGAESTNTTAPVSPMEWDEFTGMGFAGGLHDSTTLSFSEFAPPPPKQGSATYSGTSKSSRTGGRLARNQRSNEFKRPRTPANGNVTPIKEDKAFPSKDASAVLSDSAEPPLEVDETLIDGWADILTDKDVSRAWPSFAVYELRNPLVVPVATGTGNGDEPNRIRWLIVEAYVPGKPVEEPVSPSSPVKGNKVKRSSSVKSDRKQRFGFFSSTTSLGAKDKDVKEEKKEKRKDHMRRASEISTDSIGKIKEPSMSTADLAAPPPIKEEPEPTTPVKGLDEKGKAVQETAVSEKDAETFPKSEEAGVTTLQVPNAADGSRFVEGSTPGTIPESMADHPVPTHMDHEDKEVSAKLAAAAAATDEAAKVALMKLESSHEPIVPVSEDNQLAPDNKAAIETPSAPILEDSQQEHTPTVADEVIVDDTQAHHKVRSLTEEQGALTSAERGASVLAAKHQVEAEDLQVQHDAKEQDETEAQEVHDAAKEEEARLATEQLEKERLAAEQAEIDAKAEQERVQREIEELERQKAAEKQAELEREQALEAERVKQAELAELARVEAEKLEAQRLAKEEEEREAERLHQLEQAEKARLEAEELERQRIAKEQEEADARDAAERARVEEEAREAQRLAEERAEQERQAALAAEEAERARAAAEAEAEAKRQQEEQARLEAEEAERQRQAALEAQQAEEAAARLAAEEAEKARIEAERIAAEELEVQRLAEEARENARLEEEARLLAEAQRLEAEKAEQLQLEQDRLAEEKRLAEEAEAKRLEEQRLAEEAEAKRIEAERIAAEQAAEEARIAEQKRLEAEAEAKRIEEERIAAELAAEEARLAEEARVAEEKRLAEEAEAKRLEEERLAEEARIAEEQRLAAEAEAKRLEEERLAEEKRLADELEARRIEDERVAAEQAAEEARLVEEARVAEEQRLAAEAEAKRLEEERIAAEKAEDARLAEEARVAEEKRLADELEAKRIEDERVAAEQAEEARIAEEKRLADEGEAKRIEDERLAAEQAEEARIAEEKRVEEERVAAEQAEEARLAEEKRLADEIEAKRVEDEAKAVETSPEESPAAHETNDQADAVSHEPPVAPEEVDQPAQAPDDSEPVEDSSAITKAPTASEPGNDAVNHSEPATEDAPTDSAEAKPKREFVKSEEEAW